jgi:hypothetical protein
MTKVQLRPLAAVCLLAAGLISLSSHPAWSAQSVDDRAEA